MSLFEKLLTVSTGVVVFIITPMLLIPYSNKSPIINLSNQLEKPSVAQTVAEYVPPPHPIKRTQRRDGSGSRGCSEINATGLTLITPQDHVPTTISGHPTFLWYVSNTTPVQISFTLVEPEVSDSVFEKRLKVDKPGIISLRLPSNVPELIEGKEYKWTVSVICNEKRPTENTYAFAWIQRVPATPELSQKLAGASDKQKRSLIYAQSGIWYDAISMLYTNSQYNTQQNLQALEIFSSLLRQVGLSELAKHQQRLSIKTKSSAK